LRIENIYLIFLYRYKSNLSSRKHFQTGADLDLQYQCGKKKFGKN